MRNELVTWFFSIITLTVFYFITTLVHSQCLEDQKSLLLQLKNNLQFNPNPSSKLVSWNQSNDCCGWEGVVCDYFGHVQGLDLNFEHISGSIPISFQNLSHLVDLDFSYNYLTGPIPSFQRSKNLTSINLSHNDLTGPIPSFQESKNLTTINLSYNALTGPIPSFQESKNLTSIALSHNALTGPVPSIYFEGLSNLVYLSLEYNSFNGSIPSFLFSCPSLVFIDISNNQFSGTVQLESYHGLQNLKWLVLSYNRLLVNESIDDSLLSSFPQFINLHLASCKLRKFPPLMNQSMLLSVDLSDNQISGVVPNWIGNLDLSYLNLSCNRLVGFQQEFFIPDGLVLLDLHSNQLRGEMPLPPEFTIYVDYSRNNLSSMPAEIGNSIAFAYFFSASDNMLSGQIPPSICNMSVLEILNLSNNRFTGTIPPCLIDKRTATLGVLNLQNNQLTGKITGTFSEGCTLRALELNGNRLVGEVPKSLANCTESELLNLGTNNLTGHFPCFLSNLSSLRVLVLRSNKLHGNIRCRGIHDNMWPMLQIVDLSLNNFSGILPHKFFSQRKAMMDGGSAQPHLNHLGFQAADGAYYVDSVIVSNKGTYMVLVSISTIFTSIDFSINSFEGKIPSTIGDLQYLYVLNLSHNALTGSIPSSFGNLTQLESLDLSWNKLNGSIPVTLASLTFLSFLNLSYNQLTGMIPVGSQLQTFPETSFEGNNGLCGAPLASSCDEPEPTPPTLDGTRSFADEDDINLLCIAATLGYTIGFGVIVVPLLFSKRWRQRYYKLVNM